MWQVSHVLGLTDPHPEAGGIVSTRVRSGEEGSAHSRIDNALEVAFRQISLFCGLM